MEKHQKGKKIIVNPEEEVYAVNKNTWEARKMDISDKKPNYISIKRIHHMKYYDSYELKKKVYELTGDYAKYVYLLADFVDWRNCINMYHFQEVYEIQDSIMTKIRQRLSCDDKWDWPWIIAKHNKQWFMNPAIANKWDKIETEIMELFKSKNKELYNITEL